MFLGHVSQKSWERALAYFDVGVNVCVVLVYLVLCLFAGSEGSDYTNMSRSFSASRSSWYKGLVSDIAKVMVGLVLISGGGWLSKSL